MPPVTALEECAGSTPIWLTEPQQYIVVTIEHDWKFTPIHTSISLVADTLSCGCKATKLTTWHCKPFPNEYGYTREMIGKSRLNHRRNECKILLILKDETG